MRKTIVSDELKNEIDELTLSYAQFGQFGICFMMLCYLLFFFFNLHCLLATVWLCIVFWKKKSFENNILVGMLICCTWHDDLFYA